MRDRSCITQLGQSSRGAAGSSSRQMENVLAPLHAWTHSTPSAASTGRNLANLRHNFKGTWFQEPVNPAGSGCSSQIEPFCFENGLLSEFRYTSVPVFNEVEQGSSVSQFVLLVFHLPKFPRFYSHPKVPIHRALISRLYFFLCHLQRSRTPQTIFFHWSAAGLQLLWENCPIRTEPQSSCRLLERHYDCLVRAQDHWADVLY